MNERIKELAVESGLGFERWNTNEEFEVFLERFAKRVVHDCIAECWYDATPKQISDRIRKNFDIM